MQLIVITPELPAEGEARMLARMLEEGIDHVHVRHPGVSADVIDGILSGIPSSLHTRVHLHDCFELTLRHPGVGIHLNGRHPTVPSGHRGMVSRSCHTVEEAIAGGTDYVTLSPVFPSISKPGYSAAFTDSQLRSIPPGKVFALGGVTLERIEQLKRYPFLGAALLGSVWQSADPLQMARKFRVYMTK